MTLIQPPHSAFTRRRWLQLSGLSGLGLLLNSCGTSLFSDQINQITEPLNQRVEELLLRPQALIPEFPTSAIEPDKLLVNTFSFTPQLDPTTFHLKLDGEVNRPMQLTLAEIQKKALVSMVIRHVCVEGWAAIVQWGGVRLSELIRLAQPKSGVRYVYFE